jgi:hypothetical protein
MAKKYGKLGSTNIENVNIEDERFKIKEHGDQIFHIVHPHDVNPNDPMAQARTVGRTVRVQNINGSITDYIQWGTQVEVVMNVRTKEGI